MASKKKTTAPVEEQDKAVQKAQEAAQEVQPPKMAQEVPETVQAGVDLADTAVGDLSDEIVVVCAAGGLNLRTGPGRNYPVTELLEDGTLLAVLPLPCGAEVPGWALVHTGQRTGWVDSRFIRALEPAETEA